MTEYSKYTVWCPELDEDEFSIEAYDAEHAALEWVERHDVVNSYEIAVGNPRSFRIVHVRSSCGDEKEFLVSGQIKLKYFAELIGSNQSG